jgi:riboflavin kinase / FMN adenylyltransferase
VSGVCESHLVSLWKQLPGVDTSPLRTPTAVAIGVFDGVHLGHQALLAATRELADDSLRCLAVTFDPHPAMLFRPQSAPKLLTSVHRRVELLKQHGADEVRVLNFDHDLALLSPEAFIDTVLAEQCQAQHVVVGENFRFGHRASGSVDTLMELGAARGFAAHPQALVLNDATAVSSTRTREAVASGDVEQAARLLGRLHRVDGTVAEGDKRGRELGFPTANVPADPRCAVPADGVYAGWLIRAGGDRLPAAISVGTNPTFEGERDRRIEAHVLDRDDLDLYGEQIGIEFLVQLRAMQRFDTLDALVAQMREDVNATRRCTSASN